MENMKKSSFLGMLLCIAIIFSCTGAPEKDVVITGKRTLAIPTFSTEDYKVEYGTIIKFNYSPSDAQLYYTTDGSEPDIDDDDSFYYDPSKGIKLTESCTIKARLYHSSYNPSPVVGKDFKLYISEPVITPDVTEITTLEEIEIAHDSKMVKIYYTTDGSEPTEDMEEYEDPFTINKAGTCVVKAIAVRGGIKSKTVIKSYTVMEADGAYLDTLKVEANGKNYLENFKKSESNYTINVPNEVASVKVVAESKSCTVNGGNGSYDLPEGTTTSFTVFVTSNEDTTKTNMYTVNIYRAPAKASDDATLSVLELHGSGLIAFDKTFTPDETNYIAKVDSTVSSVILTFVTNHPKAVADVASGKVYTLDGDEKTIDVIVTAEDANATKTYKIKVIKQRIANDNANLKSLTVAGNNVTVSDYMAFSTAESKVEIVAKAENENASVKIDGKALTALEVSVPGTVAIVVTAEDGKTVKNYTLELAKKPGPVNTAKLTSVTVNGEDVTPDSVMSYTSKTTTADIVITAEKASSSTINGTAGTTANVTISADGKTANKIVSIILTDTNGDTVTYTLSLTYKEVITDKIILHAYGYTTLWAWDDSKNYTGGSWPGKTMTQEGSTKWYTYTLDVTKCNLLFSNSGNGQTADLSQTAGEWWYKDDKWTDYNPEDTAAPVLTAFSCNQSGTATGEVIFTVAATDDKNVAKILVTLDGEKVIGSVDASGSAYSGTFVWNSAACANGSHKFEAVAEDSAGNVSNKMDLTLTTQNVNAEPVAVITGASRAKLGSTVTFGADRSYDINGTIVGWKWRVSGARILGNDNEANCTIAFPDSEGSATVYLTVTDNDSASSVEVSQAVTVAPQVSNDFREETIYFLMTTRFYDGDKSNNRYCWDDEIHFKSETLKDPGWRGDFKGLIEKLDYIKALGFSAIWITPVVENASGLDYHGYHAFDFSRVDPRYESAGATYQDLIDACHAKGIKVIQDIVLNHTGNFGERNLIPIMKKDYASDDGSHSVPAVPDHDSKDIYGNSAYTKLSAGSKMQGFNTYEEIEASNLDASKKGEKLYQARLMTMKNDKIDTDAQGMLYHHHGNFEWESYYVQEGQMAGDCVDLNTENPKVAEYLRNCYINYINMGVDGFRIDTMKHISRLTMNKEFIPQFKEAGGDDFFMFGEGCVLRNEVWNSGMPGISVPFYTWNANSSKSDASYSWGKNATDAAANLAMAKTHFEDNDAGSQLTSNNAFLNGNEYRTPDYSKASGLHMIDFYMHHKFKDAGSAYSVAGEEDRYFNDATYNVTYVDSHDYGPNEGGYLYRRFSGGTQAWAGNFNLMFTFRGIPCVYYGSEIEFQKDMQIEPYTNGNKVPYAQSGRAYFGDHIEGTVTATDFSEYTASGKVAETLNYPLAQHVIRLNQIRRAVPALQKGQYSKDGCSGSVAFKRRFVDTKKGIDSFVLVTINGGATFTGVPNGTYVDLITGDTKSGSTITTGSIGDGNMRVYVLQNQTAKDYGATGKIGKDGAYLK